MSSAPATVAVVTPRSPGQVVHTVIDKFLALILTAGATLCLVFICISGSLDATPFNQFYWLRADTSDISDYKYTKWTFWGLCHPSSLTDSKNGKCPSLGPDVPLSPKDNFGTSDDLPSDFSKNRATYYYLSRFSFPILLIALVFSGISAIGHVMAPCWLSMRYVTSFFVVIALVFSLAGAACMTAVTVLARKQFKNAGYSAQIGAAMIGLVWAAAGALLIAVLVICISGTRKAYSIHSEYVAQQRAFELSQLQQQQAAEAQQQQLAAQQPVAAAPVVSTTAPAAAPVQASAPIATGSSQQATQQLSVDAASQEDYTQSQGALPSNEGGIRFFKIKRGKSQTDEESV